VVTGLVVAVVVAVVVVASAVARHADTHQSASPAPSAPARSSPTPVAGAASGVSAIDFVASRGTGRLTVLRRSWSGAGSPPPRSGSYLRLQVELRCTGGAVDYQPDYFSLFDADGQLVEVSPAGRGGLGTGTLHTGERVTGAVLFDLPRGSATLVLADELRSVTAVPVPA